jgi:hypothetical protein
MQEVGQALFSRAGKGRVLLDYTQGHRRFVRSWLMQIARQVAAVAAHGDILLFLSRMIHRRHHKNHSDRIGDNDEKAKKGKSFTPNFKVDAPPRKAS